jgi:hypothetical protein
VRQLAHELDGEGCRLDDLGSVALNRRRCFVGRDEQARVSRDRRKKIVQVVRDRLEIGKVLVWPQREQMCHG